MVFVSRHRREKGCAAPGCVQYKKSLHRNGGLTGACHESIPPVMSLNNPHIDARQFDPLFGVSHQTLDRNVATINSYLAGTFKPTSGWADTFKAYLGVRRVQAEQWSIPTVMMTLLSGSSHDAEEPEGTANASEKPTGKYPSTPDGLASFLDSIKSR